MKPGDQETDQQLSPIDVIGGKAPAILKAVGTPLKFFGLVAILCLPVFSIAAANVKEKLSYDAFIYTLHTYLAVVGMFALISLFSPRSLYHPREVQELQSGLMPKHSPLTPCIIALVALVMYLAYQALVVYRVAGGQSGNAAESTNTSGVVPPAR